MVLWLPSWYPTITDPLTGDFIQRHARAVAAYEQVRIIYITKCSTPQEQERVEETQTGALHEIIGYVKPLKTGIPILDKAFSFLRKRALTRKLIRKLIAQEGLPQLVHVHVALWAGIHAYWLKKKYNIPYLLTEHWTGYHKDADDNIYKQNVLFRRSSRKIVHNAKLILPVSVHLGELLTAHFGKLPYRVIPNVVDTSLFYLRSDLGQESVYRFIHVSGMNRQKNVPGILHAFSKLAKLVPNAELVTVGPADEALVQLSKELDISAQTRWTGAISYKEVAEEVRQSSCMVLFSWYENLPCAILEAMCCGLPVIATRSGGIPEIINSHNGILVDAGEEEQLLTAMRQVIADGSKYKRQDLAKEAAAAFCYTKIGKEISLIYAGLNGQP